MQTKQKTPFLVPNKIINAIQNILPLFIALILIATQTSCMTTDLKKSVSSHKKIKDEVEILESITESESITQSDYAVLIYGPFLLPFMSISTPWYSNYRIAYKSNEARFDPDGSLREFEEKQGLLKLDFGFSGIPYIYSEMIHQNRNLWFDVFKLVSEEEFKVSKMTGPVRLSDELREKIVKLRDFTELELSLISHLLQVDQIDFLYKITTRLPDGSIQNEFYKEYSIINEDIPSKSPELKILNFPSGT